jgi:hypothetical protein
MRNTGEAKYVWKNGIVKIQIVERKNRKKMSEKTGIEVTLMYERKLLELKQSRDDYKRKWEKAKKLAARYKREVEELVKELEQREK